MLNQLSLLLGPRGRGGRRAGPPELQFHKPLPRCLLCTQQLNRLNNCLTPECWPGAQFRLICLTRNPQGESWLGGHRAQHGSIFSFFILKAQQLRGTSDLDKAMWEMGASPLSPFGGGFGLKTQHQNPLTPWARTGTPVLARWPRL